MSRQIRFKEIAIKDIDRSRNHRLPRPNDAVELEKLKHSITAAGGILQPVRVYERGEHQQDKKHKEPYLLGYGDRRCTASEELGRETVPAMVFPPASDAEISQARAIENICRQDITPLEEVLAVTEMLDNIKAEPAFAGDPFEEAASRLGVEVSWVKDRDYLHRLTKPVQVFALRSGLPAGHLRDLAKVGDPAEQMRLACEAAGAPPHAFPAEPKGKLEEWQKQLQELYFTELADGKVHRWPLSHLKTQVAKVQFSLKVIPWIFDQPVQFGAVKLRKCAACPHNSETDRTLFGIDEDQNNPQGYCLNPSCFNAKHDAAQAAKEQVLKKVSQRKDQTPEIIRQLAPEWLKEGTVVGFVKRQLEKAANGEKQPPKKTASDGGRPLTDHEIALGKFSEEFRAWEARAYKAVLKGINADPAFKVSWCILLGVSAFWEQPKIQIPHVNRYASEPVTEEPVLPEFPKELEAIMQSAFKGGKSVWIELLKEEEQANPDHRHGLGIPHPRALQLLAELVKITLKPKPEWKPVSPPTAPQLGATSQVAEAVAT